MERNQLMFLTVAVAIVNGIFSPFVPALFVLWPVWYPSLVLPVTVPLLLFFTSIMISTGTLLIAGISAALWERVSGSRESTSVSVGIWLFGAVLLSLPALQRILQGL